MVGKSFKVLLFAFVTVFMLAACGNGDNGAQSAAGGDASKGGASAPQTIEIPPTTVKLFAGNINADVFQYMIVDPMAKKYPQITVEKQTGKIDDLIAAGETPDLMTAWNGGILPNQQYGVVNDMTPLIKKHNFDLSRFRDVYINAIKVLTDKGEMIGIPYYTQFNALYYNKDIFDKFGVAYPKDGLTWDETIDIAKRVTRVENGEQIQGLNYAAIQRLAFPFSPDILNAKTEQATINNEVWKRAFETAMRNDTIPGNYPNKDFNKGQVAMFANVGDGLPATRTAVQQGLFQVGFAQYPQFKEAPNTYGMVDAHYIWVTQTSKHPDAAFKVIEVMTSDEVQMAASKTYGRYSPLKDPELQKHFGEDYLPGVNMQSIFKSSPAPGTSFSELYPKGRDIVVDEYKQVATGKKDINTALRSADDRINKMVADTRGK
jgi:multiple sugar transport system substrate-binding protein